MRNRNVMRHSQNSARVSVHRRQRYRAGGGCAPEFLPKSAALAPGQRRRRPKMVAHRNGRNATPTWAVRGEDRLESRLGHLFGRWQTVALVQIGLTFTLICVFREGGQREPTPVGQIGVQLSLPAANFVPFSLRVCLFVFVWTGAHNNEKIRVLTEGMRGPWVIEGAYTRAHRRAFAWTDLTVPHEYYNRMFIRHAKSEWVETRVRRR